MNKQKPEQYRCTPRCPYRRETPGMCNAGVVQIPIKDGSLCLYPGEGQRRNFEMQQDISFREVANNKWISKPKNTQISFRETGRPIKPKKQS